jgi:SAM-dependent methyltransferase
MAMDRPTPSEAGGAWASGDVASGWLPGAAARGQALGPVTELMLDVAGVTVGSRVLDLGAGTGDQTLLAAQCVEPGGAVLATDISASIAWPHPRGARAAGLLNVETRVMDAQRLELPSGSSDVESTASSPRPATGPRGDRGRSGRWAPRQPAESGSAAARRLDSGRQPFHASTRRIRAHRAEAEDETVDAGKSPRVVGRQRRRLDPARRRLR